MRFLIFSFLLIQSVFSSALQNRADAIIGRWMSEDNNLEVEVYRTGDEFAAKVTWFDDSDDKSSPMNERLDKENPDKALRSQKILGMNVLKGLFYNAKKDVWENGKIYDATSGRTWNASVWLEEDGGLKVRGFWHFQFLGKSLYFKKVA
ncbi:MAG: DUF2147 domain-containing protein [Bacteroidota bacterium]|nr:DUF2147 domain-containing protein [Bacteroidota bacterium]